MTTLAQELVASARIQYATGTRGVKKRLTADLEKTSTFQGIEHYRCANGSRFAITHNADEVWAMPADAI